MLNANEIQAAARIIDNQFNGLAFKRVKKADIAAVLREVAGPSRTRVTPKKLAELETALFELGTKVFPIGLDVFTLDEDTRLYRVETDIGRTFEAVRVPTASSDRYLANLSKMIKGEWDFAQ